MDCQHNNRVILDITWAEIWATWLVWWNCLSCGTTGIEKGRGWVNMMRGCGVKSWSAFRVLFSRVDEWVGMQGIVPLKELHREIEKLDPLMDRNEFICFLVRLAKRKIIELIPVYECDRHKYQPGETYYSMVFGKHYYSCMLGSGAQAPAQRGKGNRSR